MPRPHTYRNTNVHNVLWSGSMTRFIFGLRTLLCTGLLFSLGVGLLLRAQTLPTSTVTLSPGVNIQAAVTAAPPGTTFVLLPGVYRMQSVQPLNGDVFIGQGKVILNGSQILSFQLIQPAAASGLRPQLPAPSTPGAVRVRILCADTLKTFSSMASCRYL
jgi:hypothetical protein